MNSVYYIYDSEFGKIIIESDGNAVTGVKTEETAKPSGKNAADALTDKTASQLDEYFSGKRKYFDVRLDLNGTAFQNSVWKALCKIPYGETRSYKQIARSVGNQNACRAVGLANNKNPIWILVPCHRVIGSNGTLTGYGGGLAMKQRLLELEKSNREEQPQT